MRSPLICARGLPAGPHPRARAIVAFVAFASFATATLLFTSANAYANPGITGYSGKPYNGVNDTCKTTCHVGGGTAPTLDITVPTAMKAGDTAEVTLVINGTRTRTSMNAALSDGVKATKGQNTDIPFPIETPGEISAVTPPPNGAKGTYKFTFVAPNKNGPITLWVAAMSANGTGDGGDGVAVTTRTITISGAVAVVPDAGSSSSSSSSGSSSSSSSSSSGSTNTSSGADAGDGGANDDDEGSTGRRLSTTSDDGAGCSSAHRSSSNESSIALLATAIAIALGRRRARARN